MMTWPNEQNATVGHEMRRETHAVALCKDRVRFVKSPPSGQNPTETIGKPADLRMALRRPPKAALRFVKFTAPDRLQSPCIDGTTDIDSLLLCERFARFG